MSIEAPIQIDLSQENSWNQVDSSLLTQDEKDMLARQFRAETREVISLTQEELLTLRDAVRSETPETLATFMSEQREEGISLSDIMGEDFEYAEDVDALDAYTKEILFGNEGILSALDISDTAQDHFSLALSLSLIERLASGEIDLEALVEAGLNLNPEDRVGALNTLFGDMITSLEGLQTLAEEEVGPGREFRRLSISDNGETNSIFMNPEEGKAFFDRVLGGNMTADEIETMLEGANDRENIAPADLESIRLETARDISSLEARLEGLDLQGRLRDAEAARIAAVAALEAAGVPHDDPETPITPERRGFIERFFEALMNFLTGLTGIEFNETPRTDPERREGPVEPTEPEEVAAQRIQEVRRFFQEHADEGIFVGMTRSSVEALFPAEGDLSPEAQRIIQRIEAIPGEESVSQKMQHLFIEEVPRVDNDVSQGNVPRLERFLSDMREIAQTNIQIKNTDNTLRVEGLESAIIAYDSYRQANDLWLQNTSENPERRNLTFREYFEQNREAGQE